MENDPRPLKLRPEDRAAPAIDEVFMALVQLNEVARHLLSESVHSRDLMSRPPVRDLLHLHGQVHANLVDIADSAGLVNDGIERLTRALRAAGRL